MTHTPGPWVADTVEDVGRGILIRAADGGPVCRVTGSAMWVGEGGSGRRDREERDANVKAITAVHDLLEALDWLLSSFRVYQDDPERTEWPEAMALAEWALAKARGEP